MHDPWTWTTVLGLPEAAGGLEEGGKGGKIGTTVKA